MRGGGTRRLDRGLGEEGEKGFCFGVQGNGLIGK